ncbi:MAG: FtsX-like permease family protein [Bryobacteraceae bacterium]|nr:FtsX-like permease family protein [Bryobacteraceae bacterium]
MIRHIPLVLRNATRNKRRTALTVLSIAASLCLLGTLLALYHNFFLRESSEAQSLRLITRNRVSLMTPLPIAHRDKMAKVPGVQLVSVLQWFGGTYKDSRDMKNIFPRFSVDAPKLFELYPEYEVSPEQKEAFLRDRAGCVVGQPLAERMGFKLGDRILLQGDIFPANLELTVRAIYTARRDNENLFFHDAYLRETLPPGWRDVGAMFVSKVEQPELLTPVARAIDDVFRNSQFETKTDTERAFEMSFLSYLGNVKLFLLAVSGALTFTILLVSANTMAMSVRERVREMGILKSLGFESRTILGILLSESVLIALIGGGLGLLLAEGICAFLRTMPILFVDLKTVGLNPFVGVACLATAVAIGVISCLIPAWGAARRPIVEAIKFND